MSLFREMRQAAEAFIANKDQVEGFLPALNNFRKHAKAAAVLELLAERDRLANEVQRITEARRIEFNNAEQVKAERDQLRSLMRSVVAEIPHAKQYKPGNAPGHSHDIAGVWDSDNGAKAGKECAWCKVWNAALAMQEAAQ